VKRREKAEQERFCSAYCSGFHRRVAEVFALRIFHRPHYAAISGNTRQYADARPFPCRVLPLNSSRIAAYPIFLPRKIRQTRGLWLRSTTAGRAPEASRLEPVCKLSKNPFLRQWAQKSQINWAFPPLSMPTLSRQSEFYHKSATCQINRPHLNSFGILPAANA